MVHKPGMEMFFGLLNPKASLYERPFSRYKARREHDSLVEALKEKFKVNARRLDSEILSAADAHTKIRAELQSIAINSIKWSGSKEQVKLAKSYIASHAQYYDSNHFLDILIMRPTLNAKLDAVRNPKSNHIKVEPLSNLYFMRDQQMASRNGIFISSMSAQQRAKETDITSLLWKAIKAPIIGVAKHPATIEGGDFMPMGDFALLGCGSRTNGLGVKQFLAADPGYDEIAVVHRPRHPLLPPASAEPMIDMHLDTYFNVAGSSIAVGPSTLLKSASVDIYYKLHKGAYSKEGTSQDLYNYLKGKGFNIIDISLAEQMSYATNFLCVSDSKILAADASRNMPLVLRDLKGKADVDMNTYGNLFKEMKREYSKMDPRGIFPNKAIERQFGIDFEVINVENLTGGYGGVHCMTAAISRS
ncbi:MAG: arginine deiminase family protein [Candidatus Micrarchaeia archaeon]